SESLRTPTSPPRDARIPPPPTRDAVFTALVAFVEPRAPSEVAALQAIATPTDLSWATRRADLDVVLHALEAASAGGSPALHCAWNGERLELRFYRMEGDVMDASFVAEMALMDAEEADGPPAGLRAARARSEAASEFDRWFEEIDGAWDGYDPRS